MTASSQTTLILPQVVAKKLRNQAREAINKLSPHASTLRELDRLGGKSQVVLAESLSEFAPSSQPLPPLPAPPADSPPSPPSPDTLVEIWNFDHLHQSIVDDWKMLESFSTSSTVPPDNFFGDSSMSFYTNMTHAPAVPIPAFESLSPFVDFGIQQYNGQPSSEGNEIVIGALANGLNGNVAAAVASAGPLSLDPSWQSFVEQLGY
jgi:hypothetical protein